MIKLMSAGVEGSTLIKHISWADNVLTVLFHNGKAFAYDNVPMFVFSALAESDSAGKFFNMFIRKTYSGYIVGNYNNPFSYSSDMHGKAKTWS